MTNILPFRLPLGNHSEAEYCDKNRQILLDLGFKLGETTRERHFRFIQVLEMPSGWTRTEREYGWASIKDGKRRERISDYEDYEHGYLSVMGARIEFKTCFEVRSTHNMGGGDVLNDNRIRNPVTSGAPKP